MLLVKYIWWWYFLKLFKVAEGKNIEEQKEKKQRIDGLMTELNGYKSANKASQDEIDGKLTDLMAELDLNSAGSSLILSIEKL